MSGGKAVKDALRTAREHRGKLGIGGAAVVILGAILSRLAAGRSSVPPVRATGVQQPPGEPN